MVTTIQLQESTREELKQFGHKGETYDEIIHGLIEIARRDLFYEKQKRILDEEGFVPLEDI